MSARYFVGIDTSTSASKALAIDESGTVVASQSYPHQVSSPHPLWSEQPASEWWNATSAALRAVTSQIPAEHIASVGLTGQMHGMTLLDAKGIPLRPAILWNDQRTGAQVEAITARVGAQKLAQTTGSMMLTGFTAPKILWVRDNEPEIYRQIAKILLPKDYIRFCLSGAMVADVADGSGYGVMDVARRTWSDDVLAALDLPRGWFPELVESPQVCARVSDEAAGQTGLKAGTPIVGGAGDQPAGGVGSGIVREGQLSLSVGTSGVAFAANSTYNPHPDGLLITYCHAVPGAWFHMAVMNSAAGSFKWLHEELAPGKDYAELNERAASVPRGSHGLLFAPYLTGERHPYYDPLARGAFVGLTLRHGLSHLIRAVMEAVGFAMRDLVELLRVQGVRPSEAVVGGGAANSAVWRQIMADIMGMPLYTVNTTEGAAFGAAILGAAGAGAYPDVASACAALVRREITVEPDAAGVADYAALYPIYRKLYPSLRGVSHDLSAYEAQGEPGRATLIV